MQEQTRSGLNPRSRISLPDIRVALLTLTISTPFPAGGCGVHKDVLDETGEGALTPVAQWEAAVCGVSRACCGPEPDALNGLASCESDLDLAFNLSDGFAGGQLGVNQQVLDQCRAAVKKTTCAAAFPDFAPCRGALVGMVAEGGVCRSTFECGRGPAGDPAICLKSTQVVGGDEVLPSATGICHASLLGKAGDACSFTVDSDLEALTFFDATSPATLTRCSRARGLECDLVSSVCVALGTEGDSCSQDHRCAPGFVCGCGLCEADQALSQAGAPFCVDGSCTSQCPRPISAGGAEFCVEAVDPHDKTCRVPMLSCGYTDRCPPSWGVAQSPNGCAAGAATTFVLGTCADTKTWHRSAAAPDDLTCYYDARSGRLVGVRNTTDTPDTFCYGASPSQLVRLAGHVPANCPGDSAGVTLTCAPIGCDGGVIP